MHDVMIIGGGLAGLAAAAGLAEHGIRSTLLESRKALGGRASSFEDTAQAEIVDNCQHVSMGCCTSLAQFCRTIGIDDFFHVEKALTFIGPDGRSCLFAADPLPAPLHLARAFARLKYLTWRDRWQLAWGLRRLARTPVERLRGRVFLDWLQENGQGERVRELFWHVVLVSAISETLDRIDAAHARKVFVDGFLSNREGWEVHIPRVPLGRLYGDRVRRWLEERGVQLRMLTGAARIEFDPAGTAASVACRNGESLIAEDVILAVPQYRVADLLPERIMADPFFARVAQIESAPIASVHLWFDTPIMDLPHAVLVGRLSQWVFRRSENITSDSSVVLRNLALAAGDGPVPPEVLKRSNYYQVVISASRGVREQGQAATVEAVVAELRDIWPRVRQARLLHSRVVIEQRAVFAATPGVDALRPSQTTPVPRLHLAGDWTDTGWPATMEGAVRSGYLAAESLLRRRGIQRSLLPPDLPVETPARWLFGLADQPSGSTSAASSAGSPEGKTV